MAFVHEENIEPQEKTYRVTGTQPVLEHEPGEVFTATIPIEQEVLLTQYGHLAVVEDQSTATQSEGETAPVETEQPDQTQGVKE